MDLSEYMCEPLPAQPIVFVVHNDTSVRESLELLIRCEGWLSESFAFAREFLARPRPMIPNCLVLDLSLRDLNGLDLQRRVVVERPDTPVIFVTGHGDVPTSVQAMKAGAIEFLPKPFGDEELLAAIDAALAADRKGRRERAELSELQKHYALLTPREREVMPFVTAGLANKQTAAELGTSEITIGVHRGQIMRKMGARSLAELVRMADRLTLARRAGQA